MRIIDPGDVQVIPALRGNEASEIRIGCHSALVPGLKLEAAALLGEEDPKAGYLLFLTNDVPFEDALSITLLDTSLKVLDRARLGGIYSTGAWRNPVIEGPGRIAFDFIDEKRWRVNVLANPAPRLTLAWEPRGTRRPFGLTRHFVLSAE
jgi:hypothetical protein